MAAEMTIDVYIDLICPWCLIGKRNLDSALSQFAQTDADTQVTVRWHSVQLLPQVPQEGWDFHAFYLQRLGGIAPLRQRQAQVNEAMALVGLQIDFSSIPRMPNTQRAHQLLAFAKPLLPASRFEGLLERLFSAHFLRREDIGNIDLLCTVADEAGLDAAAARHWIASDLGLPDHHNVPGVPFFVFNNSVTLSGGQRPCALLAAMRSSRQELAESI